MTTQHDHDAALQRLAQGHGFSQEQLQGLQALYAELDRRRARRARTVAALAGGAVLLVVAGRALAAGPCTQTLPAPLSTLCADSPALATELNDNFATLRNWILAPPGPVSGTASIAAATSLSAGTDVVATGLVKAGFNGSQGAEYAWNTQVGGGRTELINNRGGGPGGFSFFDRATPASALGTPLLTMSAGTATFSGRVGGNGALCVVPSACEDSPTFNCGGSVVCPNNKFMVGFTDGTGCMVGNKARCCALQLTACP